ncbi:MAG: hypothetical protein DCC73_06645 [Proteobacteria bacterium]|nr:MAG: hypothetical protein DCC73_06645 [Pseudomonadota bacterium]
MLKHLAFRLQTIFLGCLAVLAFAAPANAERLIDPQELEAWADTYYGRAVAEKRAAGIIVSVVQDGEVIIAKGYGYADYAKRIPVDPETSGFTIGSITKTFIATAIAQLVDHGAIASFDDPVNKYLKRIQLPGERGARVTIRYLLNHRGGFEDRFFGIRHSGKGIEVPLKPAEISRVMPELVMEPGGLAAYSNWGFSLLGFMIEDVTGERLDDYLRKNIWEPLGMAHTSMVYGKVPENLSISYQFEADGTPVRETFLDPDNPPHPGVGPMGGIVTTAADMARYMNAQILEGEDGGYPLVSKKMFAELHTEQFRNAQVGNGFGLAFWTSNLNDTRSIEHGGGAPGFQNMMVMIPEKRLGFFVSAMQGGLVPWAKKAGNDAIAKKPLNGFELRESFVDKFLKPTDHFKNGPKSDLNKLVGAYWSLRRPFTTVEVLGQAFDPAAVLVVTLTSDGKGLLMSGSGPYTEIGNGVFVSPAGKNVWNDPYALDMFSPPYISFNLDQNGNATAMTAGVPDQIWVPADPIFNPRTMLMGLALFGVLAMTGALFFLWPQKKRFANPGNYLGLLVTLAIVVIPLAMAVGFGRGDSLIKQMLVGDKTRFWIMVIAANAMVVIAFLLLFQTIKEWKQANSGATAGWAGIGRRVHMSVVALSSLALLVAFNFFNLLGMHIPG